MRPLREAVHFLVSVLFTDHGSRLLITVDAAGTLRLWTMPAPSTRLVPGKVFGLGFTASGGELAVISSGTADNAQRWNVSLWGPTRPRL